MVSPLPALSSLPLYPDDIIVLLPREVRKDKILSSNKSFKSYNQILISFPAWELAVATMGTGTGTWEFAFLSPINDVQ